MARADRSSSTSAGSRWRPGRSQAWPQHKPTEEPVYPWAMGRFMMMSDRPRLSRVVRRRDRALTPSCEVERGASALRRLVPHVEVFGSPNARWARVPRLPFMSVRLSSIRKFSVVPVHCRGAVRPAAHCGEPPSGPALPGLGGVYSFLPNLSPEALAEDRADHVFLMVDMGCAHAGTVNRARGLRRFSKRQVRV
jgi:hypothetical protein